MDGSCDVPGCSGQTYMGWRPLTEQLGRKVCEQHWRRHKDAQDSFDLFEVFGFRRPAGVTKPVVKNDAARCPCGREPSLRRYCWDCGQPREPGHRYCEKCGKKRKAQSNRKRQQHHRAEKRNAFVQPLSQAIS